MNPPTHGGVNDAAQMQNGVRALRRPQPGDGAYVAAAAPEANGTGAAAATAAVDETGAEEAAEG